MFKPFAVLVLAGCAVAAYSQQPAPHDPNIPTITVNAREVLLDVVATDKQGNAIHGLKADDFALVEDGVPLKIRGIVEHTAMSAADIAKATPEKLPDNTYRSFDINKNTNAVNVILIDALDTPTTAQMYLRQEAQKFFKTMPRGSIFAIFEMDTSMHLVQGFTDDPDLLYKAMNGKRDTPILSPVLGVNKPDKDAYILTGLNVMGRYLAAFPGRKNIIWFTSYVPKIVYGLSGNPFPDDIDYDMLHGRPANALSLSRVAIYPIDGRGLEVDQSHFLTHDKMQVVADNTGGAAIYNRNDLAQRMQQITSSSSNYYTIAYAPVNPVWAAHHRNIDLTLARKQKGATLLYRHRYYGHSERPHQRRADEKAAKTQFVPNGAPAPEELQSAIEKPRPALATVMELGSVPAGEVLFEVSAAPSITVMKFGKTDPRPEDNYLREDLLRKPFRNYRLLFTIDPDRIAFEPSKDGKLQADLTYATVLYDNGANVLNSIATSATLRVTEDEYRNILDGKRKVAVEQEIAIPTTHNEKMFLRLGVNDVASGAVGSVEIPVENIKLGVGGRGQTVQP